MITITVQDFLTHCPKVSKAWLTTKCTPVSNTLSQKGLVNVYDAERVLLIAKKSLTELQNNYGLPRQRKQDAIKTMEYVISRIEKYIRAKTQNAA